MSDVQERAAVIRKGAFKLGLALGLAGVLVGICVSWAARDNFGSQWMVQTIPFSGIVFGLPGFIIGSVLGVLLGLLPDVRIDARFITRHAISFVGSPPALILLFVLFDTLFGMPTSSTESVDDAPYCGFCCGLPMWIVFILFPACVIAESLLVERLRWRWWMHVPAMSVVFFIACVAPMVTVASLLGSDPLDSKNVNQTALLILGLEFSLWGSLYWSLLRACDNLFSIVVGEKSEEQI